MIRVVFIDTSVLCNLVPVPRRDQSRSAVQQEMKERLDQGEQFILPITAVIETGNFIAHLPDGGARRTAAQNLETMLRLVCEGKAPWVLHDVAWNREFLTGMLDGADTGRNYVALAMAELGAGDLCILTERLAYQRRTGLPTRVWTLDQHLGGYASLS